VNSAEENVRFIRILTIFHGVWWKILLIATYYLLLAFLPNLSCL